MFLDKSQELDSWAGDLLLLSAVLHRPADSLVVDPEEFRESRVLQDGFDVAPIDMPLIRAFAFLRAESGDAAVEATPFPSSA